ncbi:MAG: DNA-binding protein [Alsobacter sp.]
MASRSVGAPAKGPTMLTGDQLHAARILARLDPEQLAGQAGLTGAAVVALEQAGMAVIPDSITANAVKRALEKAGIVFLSEGGRGVLLKRTGAPDEGLRPDALNAGNDD